MALSIKNSEVELIARELSKRTGESLTQVILHALREHLTRVVKKRRTLPLAKQLDEIAERCAALPRLDSRSERDILGYDDRGLPENH